MRAPIREPGDMHPAPSGSVIPETLRFIRRAGLLQGTTGESSLEESAARDLQRRIAFIEFTRGLGLALHQVRDLLELGDAVREGETPSQAFIEAQVEVIDQKIISLMRLRKGLLQVQDCFDNDSRPGQCPVPSVLHGDIGD